MLDGVMDVVGGDVDGQPNAVLAVLLDRGGHPGIEPGPVRAGQQWLVPVEYRAARMDLETAIRTRRTHKAFGGDPMPRETLLEVLDLARFAPNHRLTEPWRFRVLGPRALERLKAAADEKERPKLDRAPTLVLASAALTGDAVQDEEDLHATACAVYIVLLAAHARGFASYWRTPAVLRTDAGRAALGLPENERFVSLIHLGSPEGAPPEKERAGGESYVTFLD